MGEVERPLILAGRPPWMPEEGKEFGGGMFAF